MLDFLSIGVIDYPRKPSIDIYPRFIVKTKSDDLMIKGGDFYAVYDEKTKMWVTDEQYVIDYVDRELRKKKNELEMHVDGVDKTISCAYMFNSDSGSIDRWHKYVQKQMRDQFHQLDERVTFTNTKIERDDYVSKTVGYPLEQGSTAAYDEVMSTLYNEEDRRKLEWAVGSVISGDSKMIQKFIVLCGEPGAGKGTFLEILGKLLNGYCETFDAKSLGMSNSSFSLEAFKNNPLVAISSDTDLSKIEDNTRLNTIVSHEPIEINAKFERKYTSKIMSFLFMGTNKKVKITDAQSGLIRRLIDVYPSGERIPFERYNQLMSQIDFELSGIAWHCLDVYKTYGRSYYDAYVPKSMIKDTNDFYGFMDYYHEEFEKEPYTTLKDVWGLYKEYCSYAEIKYPMSMRQVGSELKQYFHEYKDRYNIQGRYLRNVYIGFLEHKFDSILPTEEEIRKGYTWIQLAQNKSRLDDLLKDCPAQLAKEDGSPKMKWSYVKTKLSDIDTEELHWVKPPEMHVVVDFDLKDEEGNKSLAQNITAASKWPKTYAEVSKSGQGIHLHYKYLGNVSELNYQYDDGIEIKTFKGNSSLRRKLTKCNDVPISSISSGLPLKPKKGRDEMLDFNEVMNEKKIRAFVTNCLAKKHHGATKPEMDFMFKVLSDAYANGVAYDITDMKTDIYHFADKSTNQRLVCQNIARKLPLASRVDVSDVIVSSNEGSIIFFDVEVFPNLFVLVYKEEGEDKKCVSLINPTPLDIEKLCNHKLVGFNNRRYDNHILYGRMVEKFDNYQLYRLSQNIIAGKQNAMFRQAYNLSYTDIYDFSSKKQSLKKFEIELGIHHQELGLPWDKDVPEELWDKVAEYCQNDVIATEAVWNARHADFVAREILAKLAGMSVNSTTNSLTTKIIFGDVKDPELIYTDLATGDQFGADDTKIGTLDVCFPGYTFDSGVNMYKGEDVGKGGYVYAEPGIYQNVALLDVASMHPTSIEELNAFGKYTKMFSDIKRARLYIKHRDFESAKMMLDGKLAPYLEDESQADALAGALKIAINSVYGLTSASFNNPFRDKRNINNIVALRGALFMVDLKHAVQEQGYTVAHIKTDSIKIPDADSKIIDFVMEFGKKYGYTFEHEATYSKMCLVNNAVYIAKYNDGDHEYKLSTGEKLKTPWAATGTQFQIPYVFKKLFSKHPIKFEDMCETKSVTTAIYLDMNETLPQLGLKEVKELSDIDKVLKDDSALSDYCSKMNMTREEVGARYTELMSKEARSHEYVFIGKVGSFCPMVEGSGGGILYREKDGKYNSVGGTKGYRWLESEMVKDLDKESKIDISYYDALVNEAKETIMQYGDFEAFVS